MVTVLDHIPFSQGSLHETAVSSQRARSLAVLTEDQLRSKGRTHMIATENVLFEFGNRKVMLRVQAQKAYYTHRSNTFPYIEGQEQYETLMYLVIRPTEPPTEPKFTFTIYVVENPNSEKFDSKFAFPIKPEKNRLPLYQFSKPNSDTDIEYLKYYVHELERLKYPEALDIMAELFAGSKIRQLMESLNVADTNAPPARMVPPQQRAYATHQSLALSPMQGMPPLQQGAYAQMQPYPAYPQEQDYPEYAQIHPSALSPTQGMFQQAYAQMPTQQQPYPAYPQILAHPAYPQIQAQPTPTPRLHKDRPPLQWRRRYCMRT